MEKRTILDQIEISHDGTIGLRFAKQIIDDDGSVISSGWHRVPLPIGTDIEAQMAAVNEQLTTQLKQRDVEAAELTTLRAIAPVVWTKERTDAYTAKTSNLSSDQT